MKDASQDNNGKTAMCSMVINKNVINQIKI